jgi:serine/threonine protein kinase
MNTNHTPTSSAEVEALVSEIIEDFLSRLKHGDRPAIDEYTDRYPEIAGLLRRVLPTVEVIGPVLSETDAASKAAGQEGLASRPLGDFRIIREVGRGGMGVVYEARQVSLGRRVALKVLPFAAVLDDRQLQRFKNEAQAAAQLHHTNIVPVFSVGCERGVHYYAMQYVEGATLAEVIRELRHVSPLDTTEPSKSKDISCRLAEDLTSGCFEPPVRTPGSSTFATAAPPEETATSMLGAVATEHSTKSPAFFRSVARLGVQAAEALEHAHAHGIVHRDIKPSNLLLDTQGTLWVTDFGLAHFRTETGLSLTMPGDLLGTIRYMSPEQALGRTSFVDHRTDIYSLGTTLYEVLTLEPAFVGENRQQLLKKITDEEPHPLQRLNDATPTDLQTIVLKAMEKEPQARYATAKELSDDLRRFLEYKPIKAKRPGLTERVMKWSRRHRAVAAAAFIVLVIAVLSLSLSTVLIWRKQAQVARARERAEANFQKAREAVDQMLTQVAEEKLKHVPQMEQVRRQLLAQALTFYQGFLEEDSHDPRVREETGRAYRRVGDIHQTLGQYEQAEQAYRNAIDVLRGLADEFSGSPDYESKVAVSENGLGAVLRALGRHGQAEDAFRRAADIFLALADDFPMEPSYVKALAGTYNNLGHVLMDTSQLEEAESAYCRAIDIGEGLIGEFPTVAEYTYDLAGSYYNLGHLLDEDFYRGRFDRPLWPEQAEEAYRHALRLQKKLAADLRESPHYRHQLACISFSLGNLLWQTAQHQESQELLREATAIEEKLMEEFPTVPEYRSVLAESYYRLGVLLWTLGRNQEAVEVCQKAVGHLEKLVSDLPGVPSFHGRLAENLSFLASMVHGARDLALAEKAIDHLQIAVQLSPKQTSYREMLVRECRERLWNWRTAGYSPEEVRQNYEEIMGFLEDRVEDVPTCRYEQAILMTCWGDLLKDSGQPEGAQTVYEHAESIRQALVAELPNLSYGYRKTYFPWEKRRGGGSSVHYEVQIGTVGDYQLYVRCDGHDVGSDSFYAWIEELADGPQGTVADWYRYSPFPDADFGTRPWLGSAGFERYDSAGHDMAAIWSVSSPGDYTIRFAVREDGVAVDALVFQLASLPPPEGAGPEESEMTEEMVFLESNGCVAVEAEHFTSRTPHGRNWLVVPDEDLGDVAHRNFRGTGYLQVLPDQTLKLEKKLEEATRGIEADPDNPAAFLERGNRYWGSRQYDKALADYSTAVGLQPDLWQAWLRGGPTPALWTQLGQAGFRDFAKVTELGSDPVRRGHVIALLQLYGGDSERYRKTCASMLDYFGRTEEPETAYWVAWTCVLAPEAVEDLGQVVQLAQKAVEGDDSNESYLTALGAALFRASRLDEAVEYLSELSSKWDRTEAIPLQVSSPDACFLMAMAHHRLGNSGEAKIWLARAVMPAEREDLTGDNWTRKLTLRLLRAEAEWLINGKEVETEKNE